MVGVATTDETEYETGLSNFIKIFPKESSILVAYVSLSIGLAISLAYVVIASALIHGARKV